MNPSEPEVGVNDPDKEPYRPEHAYGWYFKVFHELYGFYPTEGEAWEHYERVRDRVYE